MIKSYGKMILKKDTVLYHTSDDIFTEKTNIEKPFLFCTFHPSDFIGEYIAYIKLKKDIELLFMIETINKNRIFSSLHKYINDPNKNLAKKKIDNLLCYSNEIKKLKLDGWFSSIENKTAVEIALLNDNNLYKITKKNIFLNNSNNKNNNEPKNWGFKYKIYTIKYPIILKINLKYKNEIDKYMNSSKLKKYSFQIVLENAIIIYNDYPVKEFSWICNKKNINISNGK